MVLRYRPRKVSHRTLGVVLDGEAVADNAGAVQVLGFQTSPPLEGQGRVPAGTIAPERGAPNVRFCQDPALQGSVARSSEA